MLGTDSRGADGAELLAEAAGWGVRDGDSERASARAAGTPLSRAKAGAVSKKPTAEMPAYAIHFLYSFFHIPSLLSPAGKYSLF